MTDSTEPLVEVSVALTTDEWATVFGMLAAAAEMGTDRTAKFQSIARKIDMQVNHAFDLAILNLTDPIDILKRRQED